MSTEIRSPNLHGDIKSRLAASFGPIGLRWDRERFALMVEVGRTVGRFDWQALSDMARYWPGEFETIIAVTVDHENRIRGEAEELHLRVDGERITAAAEWIRGEVLPVARRPLAQSGQ